MKKLICLIIILIANLGFSQVYETGISYNLGNVLGERNEAFPLTLSENNFGITLKKNMNPRISYRIGFNLLESFDTKLTEISAGVDFNFKKYNPIRVGSSYKSTPYIIFEAVGLLYDKADSTKFRLAIPMGVGYKHKIARHLVYSLEAKTRIAFSDALDSNTTNKSTLDAYYYLGASIYYTFGWPRGSKNQIRF